MECKPPDDSFIFQVCGKRVQVFVVTVKPGDVQCFSDFSVAITSEKEHVRSIVSIGQPQSFRQQLKEQFLLLPLGNCFSLVLRGDATDNVLFQTGLFLMFFYVSDCLVEELIHSCLFHFLRYQTIDCGRDGVHGQPIQSSVPQ